MFVLELHLLFLKISNDTRMITVNSSSRILVQVLLVRTVLVRDEPNNNTKDRYETERQGETCGVHDACRRAAERAPSQSQAASSAVLSLLCTSNYFVYFLLGIYDTRTRLKTI